MIEPAAEMPSSRESIAIPELCKGPRLNKTTYKYMPSCVTINEVEELC